MAKTPRLKISLSDLEADDLDGADAVQRIHLVLMDEADDKAFIAVHAALPPGAPVKRRLKKELRKVA